MSLDAPLAPSDPGYLQDVIARVMAGRLSITDVKIIEHVTLDKFDGDPPAFPGEKLPVERIVIEDGRLISITHPSAEAAKQ